MKKLSFVAALGIGTMFTTSAWAADCIKADCASMGYSSSLPTNCLESINCPFDTAYKACTHYQDEWLDSCPAGKTCTKKYKVTGDEAACPLLGFQKTLAECGTDAHGSYSLGTSLSSNPSCKQCVLTCNTGYMNWSNVCQYCPDVLLNGNPYCFGKCNLLGGTYGSSLNPSNDGANFLTQDVTLSNAEISNNSNAASYSGMFVSTATKGGASTAPMNTCGFVENPKLTLNNLVVKGWVEADFEVPVSGTIDVDGSVSGYKLFQFLNTTDVTIKSTKSNIGVSVDMELYPNEYPDGKDIVLTFDACNATNGNSCYAELEVMGDTGPNKVYYKIKGPSGPYYGTWKISCAGRSDDCIEKK